MDIVDQYLRAVAALLPRAQRDDITAELRDIILSRIEAREAGLGRRLSDDEIEDELRGVGHPILVAARYREEPQHLVGPSLYPYWMFAVKIAVAIQATAVLVVLLVRILNGQDFGNALGHAIGQGVTGFVTLVGVATVVAWLIERGKLHIAYLDHWRVRDLGVLEYAGWDFNDLLNHFRREQAPRAPDAGKVRLYRHHRSPVSQAIVMIAFGTVFILWWAGVIPLTIFAPATRLDHLGANLFTVTGVNLGDLHAMLFWPLLAYSAAIILQSVLILIYPGVVWLRGLVAILMGTAMLALCIWIWTVSPIASSIRVDSLAELMLKLKDLHKGLPLSLAPIITIFLGCAAFGAVINIVKGLWEMLILPNQGAEACSYYFAETSWGMVSFCHPECSFLAQSGLHPLTLTLPETPSVRRP